MDPDGNRPFAMFPEKAITKPEAIQCLLSCRRLPGRLTTGETAVLLGFAEHDISLLVAGRMLKPLGQPAPNAPKYFAAIDVTKYASDSDWLSKATKVIALHWRRKNSRKAAVLS
jgi:hypothetical protein